MELADLPKVMPSSDAVKAGGERNNIDTWRSEIRRYHKEMEELVGPGADPQTVLRTISVWLSRTGFIRFNLKQSGSKSAEIFRVNTVDPFRADADQQFKIWSRISSIMKEEWEISR